MITFMSNEDNDWILDPNNNLAIGTGDSNIHGQEALAVCARHYAQTILGEMIHQTDRGLPFFGDVFGQVQLISFEAALRERLLELEGVIEVLNVETTIIDDILSYSVDIKTIYGNITISN